MKEISVCRYQLRFRHAPNARVTALRGWVRDGVMLRIGGGYGCLQPWPELGEKPMHEQLEMLRAGGRTPQIERAVECAEMDGAARQEGRNLFQGLRVPASHATLLTEPTDAEMDALLMHGIAVVKMKAGENWAANLSVWEAMAARGFRLRLDFNGVLDENALRELCAEFSPLLRKAVDFLEDPMPFDRHAWQRAQTATGVRFAADRACQAPGAEAFLGVLKPAVDDVGAALRAAPQTGRRFVVTTNMDHPMGQLWAAWHAARVAEAGLLEGACGLLTHSLLEGAQEMFSGTLQVGQGGVLVPPPGLGLGYDAEQLDTLQWIPLGSA